MPLLAMKKYDDLVPGRSGFTIHYAGRAASITDSHAHGGFDNDRSTMNNILKNILGKKPSTAKGFQPEDMTGY